MKNILIVILLISNVFFGWLALSCSRQDAMEQLYNQVNAFTMFEDGSYVAETRDNREFSGCIQGALCDAN